ncbi:MAG: DUF1934 domain-containing protein [Angelakisella sp.]|nr:DUF1934 domain-containing protein [Angelakisella sp.]
MNHKNMEDFLIKIKGVQIVQGDSDVVEVLTKGSFCRTKDAYLISYDESAATGFDGAHTTLRFDLADNRVTMSRTGSLNTQLIIEEGQRHQCTYDTGYGQMTIGVLGNRIQHNLSEEGGDISFGYSLDVDTALASENKVYISVAKPQ